MELGESLDARERVTHRAVDSHAASIGVSVPQLTAALERRLKFEDAKATGNPHHIKVRTTSAGSTKLTALASQVQAPAKGNHPRGGQDQRSQASLQSDVERANPASLLEYMRSRHFVRADDEITKQLLGKTASEFEREWQEQAAETREAVETAQRALMALDPTRSRLALDENELSSALLQATVTTVNTTVTNGTANGTSLIEGTKKKKKKVEIEPMPPPPIQRPKYPWLKSPHMPWCYDQCPVQAQKPYFILQSKVDLPYGLMDHGQFISYVHGENRIPDSEFDWYEKKVQEAKAAASGGTGGGGLLGGLMNMGKRLLGGIKRRVSSPGARRQAMSKFGSKLGGAAGAGAAGAPPGPTKTRTYLHPPTFPKELQGKEAFGMKKKRYRCFTCDLRMDKKKENQASLDMIKASAAKTKAHAVAESMAFQLVGKNELQYMIDRIPPSVQNVNVRPPRSGKPTTARVRPDHVREYVRKIVRSSKPMMSIKICMNEQSAAFATALASGVKPMFAWVANCY